MRKSTALLLSLSLASVAHGQGNDPGAPDLWAITDAKIVTAPGKVIEKGTLVLRNGVIEAVGATVKAPADAKVISGKGLTLYPGLIDASTRLGMPTEAPKSDRGDRYPVAAVQAENTAALLLKPDADAFKPYRQAGFGVALTAPATGLYSGTSAAILLGESSDPAALTLKPRVGMHLGFGSGSFGEYPGSLMGQFAVARQALYDASVKPAKGSPSRALVALKSVVEKKLPLVIRANGAREIERALRLCAEFGLTPIIEGGTEAYAVAEQLKKAKATVFLSADLPALPTGEAVAQESLQSLRAYALAPTAAAALAKVGVPFALTTSTPADLLKNTRKLIAAGLSEEQALTALTLSPAKLLGIEKQAGTLEPGKLANVIAVEGDSLFAAKAKLSRVFIDGKPVALTATTAPPAPNTGGTSGGGAALDIKKLLPPGVTPEMALQFLKSNPEEAKAFLPAGVTVAQAIAGLEGTPQPGSSPIIGGKGEEKPFVLAKVGTGLVPPLPPQTATTFILRNATVWTSGPQGVLKDTDVLIENGKLAAIGKALKAPSGAVEVDGRGKHVTPGMIDCHSHTAVAGSVNEGSNIVTAECRIEDVLNPDDVNIYRQLAGGTTAANILHGSANAIGGQNATVKWRWGADAQGLLIQGAPQGIKFALGENPTRSNSGFAREGTPRYPASRMGVERVIRARFTEAREYAAKRKADPKNTRRDLQLEALVEILEGKRLVHCHSYVASEILMLIRLADEFGFKVATFQHVLEGYKVADEIAKHGAGGSTFSDWWGYKLEAYDAIPWNGALMTERGVTVSFNSDSSELARRLNTEAAKAVRWGGMRPEEALKLVTINPAKQLHIDKQTGSLEVGKDADVVLWSGDPLSPLTVAEKTFVDGKLLFDRQADLAVRKELEAEKARLLKELGTNLPPQSPFPQREGVALSGAGGGSAGGGKAGMPLTGPITAFVGGTVHTVSGADIPKGVVLVQGARILAVGKADEVSIPAGAKTVDLAGQHLYPGLINAHTTVGANEIDSRRETQDISELAPYQPELLVAHSINPDSEAIKVARAEGVLSAFVAPTSGTFAGMGALINLDGWTWEEMSLNPVAGLLATLPGGSGGRRRFGEADHGCDDDADDWINRAGAQPPAGVRRGPGAPPVVGGPGTSDPLAPVAEFLEQARRYQLARTANPKTPRDLKFEAMIPVLEGKVPVYVRASAKKEIETAVTWAQKEGFRLVIVGGSEADDCAGLLAQAKVPVLLGPTLALPRRADAPYDDVFTLPGRLAQAGVSFALTTGGDSEKVRNLAQHAAMAAAFGLSRAEAVKSITLEAARILGVESRLGSIEVGKDANLVVTSGDILEVMTQVRQAFVAGQPVSLTSKQSGLYERWRSRPKK